jgi:hypothetical protein
MGRCLLVRLGLIGLTGLAACASLDGLSGSTSGDGGGGRDGTTDARRARTDAKPGTDGRVQKEASPESDASHMLDASVDSARVDGTARDAGHDSGHDAGHDAAQPRCPGYTDALLCDNFDQSPLGALWNQQSLIAGALTLSSAKAFSPPNALLSVINPNGTSGEGSASLVYTAGQTFNKVRNSYDVYIDQAGQRSAAIGSIYLLNGLRYYGVYLFVHAGGTVMNIAEEGIIADGGDDTTLHSFPVFPLQTWIRVILEVDYGASPTVTLTLQDPPGTPATPVLNAIPIVPTITGASMSAYAGIDYVAFPETTGWQVYTDNVVLEAPP